MNTRFKLKHGIFIYSGENNIGEESVYIETAAAKKDGTFSSAKPMTEQGFKNLLQTAYDQTKKIESKILDPGIIFLDQSIATFRIIWYRKHCMKKIHVTSQNKVYNIWIPSMLYFLENNTVHLYALKTVQRPTANTTLYVPPVKNLTGKLEDAEFCWGGVDNTVDQNSVNEIIKSWESIIWDTGFNDDGPETIKQGNVYDLYELLDKYKSKFPKRQLVPAYKNIETLLNHTT